MARIGRGYAAVPFVYRYPGNTVAPSFSVNPAASAIGADTVDIGYTATDDLGPGVTGFMSLYAAGSTPTAADIVAGTGTGYVAASAVSTFASSGVGATFAQRTGLGNGHPYRAAITLRDSYFNFSAPYYLDFITAIGQGTLGSTDSTGFAGTLNNPKTVTLDKLQLRNGTARASLANLHWSWYDADDVDNLGSRIDHGTTGATDVSGIAQFAIPHSTLTTGQYGRLLLETSDKVSLGHFRLQVP